MPELPEVETIKNDLYPEVTGRRFTGVSIFAPRMVLQPPVDELRQRLTGQTVKDLVRRGKYLIFCLNSGEALVLHMRMTGSLILNNKGSTTGESIPYIRAVFGLDNGVELLFCDRRKLGTVSLIDSEHELDRKLGPEPLESGFTPELLQTRLGRRKAPIKAVLCDQKFIAGIGNMYADEALFLARIHPLRNANSLSKKETGRLHKAIRETLRTAIDNGGATVSDYYRPDGKPGRQQFAFYVAHRRGQNCKVCGTPLERIAIRNRGTYFCPKCQRLSGRLHN